MKILQINICVNKGSVSRITEQIGLKILNEGWESYIAYGRPSNPSKSNLIQIGSYEGVKFHYLLSQLTGRHGLYSTKATKELVERIKDVKPDIIHLQNIHGYYLNYRILFEYLNKTSIPVIWTLHDCWSFTGHCAHFVTVGCERWKSGCYNCPLKKAYPRSLLLDFSKEDYVLKRKLFTGNSNLHLVAVSHWLENLVKQSFFKNLDVRVIHNGIDLKVFRPYQHISTKQTKIIGVASMWNKDKGLEDFYKLRNILDKDRYVIILVGLSDEQMRTLPQGIEGIKRTDSTEQLAQLYSEADVFLNLTYADTFPTVNIESLACGTPVITYRTGGSTEIVDRTTGIVVEQGNIEEVLSAIEAIVNLSAEQKLEQRLSCRQRAEVLYEKGKCFDQYIKLYKELVRSSAI